MSRRLATAGRAGWRDWARGRMREMVRKPAQGLTDAETTAAVSAPPRSSALLRRNESVSSRACRMLQCSDRLVAGRRKKWGVLCAARCGPQGKGPSGLGTGSCVVIGRQRLGLAARPAQNNLGRGLDSRERLKRAGGPEAANTGWVHGRWILMGWRSGLLGRAGCTLRFGG